MSEMLAETDRFSASGSLRRHIFTFTFEAVTVRSRTTSATPVAGEVYLQENYDPKIEISSKIRQVLATAYGSIRATQSSFRSYGATLIKSRSGVDDKVGEACRNRYSVRL